MRAEARPLRSENRLLAALGAEDRERLAGALQRVQLSSGQLLYEAGAATRHVYFPESGLASILAVTGAGGTVAIATVGNEGVIGWPVVLDAQPPAQKVVVQLSGVAVRISADTLRAEFGRAGTLQQVLLRYTLSLFAQISQSVVCHRFHTVPQRLARWLLLVRGHAPSDTLELTQGDIASVLGIPRTGVTEAAGELKNAGVIWYRHGRVVIVSRERLEREACECHRAASTWRDGGGIAVPSRPPRA